MNFTVEWLDEIDSTNDEMLRRLLKNRASISDGYVICAKSQTAGRGRHKRKWLAEAGCNLLFSFFVETDAPLINIPSLTMAVAMGIDDALKEFGVNSTLKWPNDILVGDKKICGILSEGVPNLGAIVGIGLNVNMDSVALSGIDRPATSIRKELGEVQNLDLILNSVLENLPRWINRWKEEFFQGIRGTYEKKCAAFGREVTVSDDDKKVSGRLVGFGDYGEAVLSLSDGSSYSVWAGDLEAKPI